MKRRHVVTSISIVVLIACGFAANWQRVNGKSDPAHAVSPPEPQVLARQEPQVKSDISIEQSATVIPRQIAYGLFFAEMAAFTQKAEENERRGLDGSAFRNHHKERANLDNGHNESLERIAAECNKAVLEINDQARRVINRDRARHPRGKLYDGESLPLPPAELKDLEEQRTAIVLKARENVREAFGEKEFQRFDNFVQQDIASRTKTVARNGKRP